MQLESKFNLNEKVYYVRNVRIKTRKSCNICNGIGLVKLKSTNFSCPECHGNGGRLIIGPNQWQVEGSSKIGQITIEAQNIEPEGDFNNIGHYKEGVTTIEIKYMLYVTGIGSGTGWSENKLFSTLEEAEDECARLNG